MKKTTTTCGYEIIHISTLKINIVYRNRRRTREKQFLHLYIDFFLRIHKSVLAIAKKIFVPIAIGCFAVTVVIAVYFQIDRLRFLSHLNYRLRHSIYKLQTNLA